MRSIRKTVAAAAISPWIPVSRQSYGTMGFTVAPQTGTAGGTYDVEFTESDVFTVIPNIELSRTTTSLTVSLENHGLKAGDSITLTRGSEWDGVYQVASITDADNLVVTVANSGSATGKAGVIPMVVDDITDFAATSGKKSGNIYASTTAVRLNCLSEPTIKHDFYLNQKES